MNLVFFWLDVGLRHIGNRWIEENIQQERKQIQERIQWSANIKCSSHECWCSDFQPYLKISSGLNFLFFPLSDYLTHKLQLLLEVVQQEIKTYWENHQNSHEKIKSTYSVSDTFDSTKSRPRSYSFNYCKWGWAWAKTLLQVFLSLPIGMSVSHLFLLFPFFSRTI